MSPKAKKSGAGLSRFSLRRVWNTPDEEKDSRKFDASQQESYSCSLVDRVLSFEHPRPKLAGTSPEESKLNTPEYLDLARQKLTLPSDYALQKPLGVTKQLISKYRTGKETLSNGIALKLAVLTGLRAERVLVEAQIEKAKTPEERVVWESILEKISESFNRHLLGSWHGEERRFFTVQ